MSDTLVRWFTVGWLFGSADASENSPRHRRVANDAAGAAPELASPVDEKLIAQLRAGDESAYHDLWTRYVGRLVSFAAPRIGSPDIAADLVQDVFVTLWCDRTRLAPRVGIEAYLYRAVLHRIQNARRRRSRSEAYLRYNALLQSRAPSTTSKGADDVVEAGEASALIERLLGRMSPRVREIFLLSRDEGLTAPEIAGMLGIGAQVVRNQLAVAMRILAENLRSFQEGGDTER
jgi:RNA polymerase sigma factor (sigma-70 family)